jgi:hypothetical protein
VFWVVDPRSGNAPSTLNLVTMVTSNKNHLIDCKKIVDGSIIHMSNGTSCHVTHEGIFSSHFYVPEISLVPQLSMDLLSIGQKADINCLLVLMTHHVYSRPWHWSCDWDMSSS